VVAYSSGRLPGDIEDRASSTLDGNPSTVWSPGLGPQAGNWLEYDLAHPLTFDQLSMAIVADGRHSVPTSVTVSADGQSRTVALPAVADTNKVWATQTETVRFPALSGSHVRVTFDSVRAVHDLDYYSDKQIDLPIGVAELAIPGMPQGRPAPATLPGTCRSDLLGIDGTPVPVAVTGSLATASSLGQLQLRGCGSAAGGVTLGAGPHELDTRAGFSSGVDVDVDALVLDSAPGGGALAPGASGRTLPTQSGPAPSVTVRQLSTTSASVVVHHPTGAFWVVLGESTNAGWHATVAGKDLGTPQVVDGYANGWLVTPGSSGQDMVITFTWQPQRFVDVGIVASAVAIMTCIGLACWPPGRRVLRRRRAAPSEAAAVAVTALAGPVDRKPRAGTVATSAVATSAVDETPVLGAPWRSAGSRPRWAVVAVSSVVAGAIASVVITPLAGVPVALATMMALVARHARLLLAIAAVGLLVAVDAMVTAAQGEFHYLAEFGWPTHFGTANTLAWLAVAALAADGLVQVLRMRSGQPQSQAPSSTDPPAAPADDATNGPTRVQRLLRARRGKHVRGPS
jgi:arabinofuranan 3-O-arabinosyltransferase